ncbi:sugar ABC transporter ATP-binding protein [Shinella sp.]|uniref:sugar ABC transporter ATP-binding protein n=1 Tax=Shinella sp. TaxID=1870904 RepID=UPI00258A1FA4|nr:sugar ABC transporter ATP-binding protein [Shinella sp.]MCW5708198.1 sugar ABC transporter ATP-binding protein [Shinella sp.]
MAGLVEMTGIGKSFGRVAVLSDVSLRVDEGKVVALLGANGAGKSTLMKILSGNYTRDAGEIRIDGRPADFRAPADAIAGGIRLLPQELSIFPDLTVAENIMLGALPTKGSGPLRTVDKAAAEARAAELLVRMGLDWLSPRTRMGTVSHHVQRIVEIARAMAGNARMLIMDEPTASLADAEVKMLFQCVRRLQAEGISVVYISHYLKEVFEISDEIVVLRDGRNAGRFETKKTDVDAVLEAIVGNRVGNLYPDFARSTGVASDVVTVEGLTVDGWLHGIDFTIRKGQITGMHGLIGSGVEMAGRALFGAVPKARAARTTVDGRPYTIRYAEAGVAAGLGLVAAERKQEGIISMLSLRENMSVCNLPLFTKGLVVQRKTETATADDWIRRFAIRARGAEQAIGSLSGGNQQKVCLARWLIGDLKALILEEPTRGVDVGARAEIYRQIRQMADNGLGILLISSDAEEVAGLADRSVVLDGGRVAATYEAPVSAAMLMNAASKPAAAEAI